MKNETAAIEIIRVAEGNPGALGRIADFEQEHVQKMVDEMQAEPIVQNQA